MFGSTFETGGVRVDVRSEFVPHRSSPKDRHYFFVYHVTISNVGDEPVKLVTRHWIITNGEGKVQEVRGPGVVGQTPRLLPGQSFEYSSACPLDTPVGVMQGSFQMVKDDGAGFDAKIAPFTLAEPMSLN